ncbi:MAG TPA: sialidase family protein, partial [Candidatus Binatia bacterium]|nr:sialidase family protein [Candidatus Binatia bacterium]
MLSGPSRFAAGALFLLALRPALSDAAAPAVVSDVFLAGQNSFDEWQSRLECVDSAGTLHRVRQTNAYDISDSIIVDRSDVAGVPLPSVMVELPGFVYDDGAVNCSAAGSFLVQVMVYGPDTEVHWVVRAYDGQGEPRGAFFHLPIELEYQPLGLAIHDELGIYSARFVRTDETGQIVGQWLDYDGEPITAPMQLGESFHPWGAAVGIDEDSHVLVLWRQYAESCDTLWARATDSTGQPLGEPLLLADCDIPGVGLPRAASESAGLFQVSWLSHAYDGRVARWLSIDPDLFSAPATTTTTLPNSSPQAVFGGEKNLGNLAEGNSPNMVWLGSDGRGTWLSTWSERIRDDIHGLTRRWAIAASTDLGATWRAVDGLQPWNVAMAAGSNGTWVAATRRHQEPGLSVRVTRDGGAVWDEQVVAEECSPGCHPHGIAIATDHRGRWAITWNDERFIGDPVRSVETAIFIVMSGDDGQTWEAPRTLRTIQAREYLETRVAADGAGTWIVSWSARNSRELGLVRSVSNGVAWSQPIQVLPATDDTDDASSISPGSLSLLHVSGHTWTMGFSSRPPAAKGFGGDGDIFVLRSIDGGASWSEPLPVNSYARIDSGTDSQPVMAVSDGKLLAAWTAHDPLGGPLEPNSDILTATSGDGGLSWTGPDSLDALPDRQGSGFPLLAAADGDRWMLTWRTWPQGAFSYRADHELRMLTSPSD